LNLFSTDLTGLIVSLEENATLKLLDICGNQFGCTPLLSRLASALTVNQTLETLILDSCDISDDSCSILAEKLPFMKGLKELNLNYNPFLNYGARHLLDGLKSNVNLLSLQVREYRMCWSGSQLRYNDYDEAYKSEYEQMQRLLLVNRDR
jgi:hypothetical protein